LPFGMALLYWEKFKKARKGAGKSPPFCLWGLQQFLWDDELLHKAKVPSVQIRRIRTMALETFKIVNKITHVCLQNLVSVKNSKYSFRYVNVLDVPRFKSTHYGKNIFQVCCRSISHFKSLIQSWSGSKCRCSACR
jgi:hypothetical protein